MFGAKIVCPYCFNETNLDKVEYMCLGAASGCSLAKSNTPIPKPKIRNHLATCTECGKTTNVFRCPNPKCHKKLPPEMTNAKTRIVSVVGCKSSGKSYYIGTLLKLIMEDALLCDYNQISTSWVDNKRDKQEYLDRYKKFFDKGVRLSSTNTISNILTDNPPILVVLEQLKHGIKKSDIFSFFDAAGENYDSPEMIESIAPYFKNSDAIILILDPRQIDTYRTDIDNCYKDIKLGDSVDMSFQEVLEPTIDLVRKELKLGNSKKIDIPLCIAFSKWDLMVNCPDMVPEDLLIGRISGFNGKYDENRVNTASQELRSLLNSIPTGKNLITIAERNFQTVNYFAFSAWGTPPSENEQVPKPVPYRVEDPFLWVLRKDKII